MPNSNNGKSDLSKNELLKMQCLDYGCREHILVKKNVKDLEEDGKELKKVIDTMRSKCNDHQAKVNDDLSKKVGISMFQTLLGAMGVIMTIMFSIVIILYSLTSTKIDKMTDNLGKFNQSLMMKTSDIEHDTDINKNSIINLSEKLKDHVDLIKASKFYKP